MGEKVGKKKISSFWPIDALELERKLCRAVVRGTSELVAGEQRLHRVTAGIEDLQLTGRKEGPEPLTGVDGRVSLVNNANLLSTFWVLEFREGIS